MASLFDWMKRRNTERLFIFFGAIVLAFVFFRMYMMEKENFSDVQQRLRDGTMIDLNAGKQDQQVRMLLQRGFYFEDQQDIAFAASAVGKGFTTLSSRMDNIGELNKRNFYVNADEAFASGGESYKKRVKLSRSLLGFTDDDSLLFESEKNKPQPLPSVNNISLGTQSLSGTIYSTDKQVVPGVLVRLQLIVPADSLGVGIVDPDSVFRETTGALRRIYLFDTAGNRQMQTFTAYARTDQQGEFTFQGLPEGKAYEVLPLKPGFQFGASKGVEKLEKAASFKFYQAPHTMKLFSTADFNNLKKEKALIVRLPEDVEPWFVIIPTAFFLGFFLLHILLCVRFPTADQFILPVLMLLIGLSFVTLFSLQDSLRDRFLAQNTFGYFLGGVAAICILLFFDLKRFTTDSRLYRLFVFTGDKRAGNGWPWAVGAVLLLGLTIIFGSGPEGSGVKVNLFGFQPSELVKFLIIIFLAGFFATNEKFISEYTRWQKRWSFFSFALVAIVLAILSFLILGDLGPAMVACFSFIILFSFSRGDFLMTVATVVVYVLSIWLLEDILLATAIAAIVIMSSAFFLRTGMSESSVMTLVVMAGFLFLDKIPFLAQLFPGPMQRLIDRKAIWQDPWNNEVFGGDHIANSIWGMSSGGITGQGIGEGFAKTIPEAHTDMILPSVGEEFGWAGVLSVFILFLIYLHRAIVIGRQTGRSFLFFLCAGVGISTFVQFLLIAGGSIGALPLSGVSLPFMSYGGSSLIINMIAAGFLLSVSLVRGSQVQMRYIAAQQDKNLMPALLAACVGIVLLGVNVSQYLFNNEKWVVQPALVADRSGARIFSYNPRIAILMNRLQAGSLFDRNGMLLATSDPELIAAQRDTLARTGLDPRSLQLMMHRRLDRYYPFEEHMFFWTGDFNNGYFMGGTNGYFAEYEHIAELRGFPTPEQHFKVTATKLRAERFLPPQTTEMTVLKRDYSALAYMLLAGINSKEVEEFKQRNRDVHLSMDATLQTELQLALQNLDTLNETSRISVVVMESSTGDVLTSAAYPLPTVDEPEKLQLTIAEQNKLPFWITNSDLGFTTASQPGSAAKLATALAAFNKLGMAAAQKTIVVRPGDLIRTKGEEPDEAGTINIERGLVRSNNPFFIRLANEERLEEEMATIYMQTGMFLRGVGGYYFEGEHGNTSQQNEWRDLWRKTEFRSRLSYNKDNIRRTRGRGISGMAWGQGELIATPASLARLAAGIANNGVMMQNRYVIRISDSTLPVKQGIPVANDPRYAELMTDYMKKQSAGKVHRLGMAVAGKTGTPERIVRSQRINDGWYVFFTPNASGPGHIVTCIRIENCRGSSVAVRLAGSHIIPILLKKGYIRGFDGAPDNKNP